MTGNLRYLCADGEVLVEQDRGDDSVTFSRADWTRTVTTERTDPCAFDATCTTCGGKQGALVEDEECEDFVLCDTCLGHGVVETVPLRLVGVGSVLRPNHPDPRIGVTDGPWLVVSLSTERAVIANMVGRGDHRLRLDAISKGAWRVVRAVPPDCTEETP